ncbi:MAG: hypothetical protein ICV55_15435 [Coleofasciculus sp. C3-bin4]|nr:hypothetical protein [Coleofasciculus sp. C3-bin4]
MRIHRAVGEYRQGISVGRRLKRRSNSPHAADENAWVTEERSHPTTQGWVNEQLGF